VCGTRPTITELIDYEGFCGVPAVEERRMREISASELAELRKRGEPFLLIDVRQPEEWQRARIEGARLIPLGELPARVAELADWKERRVVAHCHHGGRSAKACEILAAAGFTDLTNVVGGIDAWSLTVDPSVPRY
jgi:adenylyltransferase/sulfurtransferase